MNGFISAHDFEAITYNGKAYLSKDDLIAWSLKSASMNEGDIKATFTRIAQYIAELKKEVA